MNRKIDKPVLEKPIVGGSKDVWGDILNVNIDNTEKFHTQLLSDLETKDAELARLERDKASKSDLPDLVHPIVDNYVESSVKPTINEYIDSTSKPAINSHVESKKQELNSYVNTTNKPELDKYTKAKEGELDAHTGKKKSELDSYEKAKEGQLDSHTNTKKEELNQHTVQKQGQLDEYTTAKKGELDSHTTEKKNELNTHEKAKEKELDNYVTTVNKPELDKYTNIKKEELNSHTKAKESEITQVTETKKQEITAHGTSELDKFNQGAKQEADKQIGRVVAEGDVQVQRVKDESNGVIPRIEQLESEKVNRRGDTITGSLTMKGGSPIFFTGEGDKKNEFGYNKNYNHVYIYNSTSKKQLTMYDDGRLTIPADNLNTQSKEVVGAINELNSKKSDLTGSTFTGLVAIKKDTDGEAMVALNSAYGNGDIYSGGSAKGVGFKNRTSGKGLFLTDSGKLFLEGENIDGPRKDVVECLNLNIGSFKGRVQTLQDMNTPGVYTVVPDTQDTPYNTWGIIINMYEHGKSGTNKQLWLSTGMSGYLAEKTGTNQWIKYWSEANFDPSTKLDKTGGNLTGPISFYDGKFKDTHQIIGFRDGDSDLNKRMHEEEMSFSYTGTKLHSSVVNGFNTFNNANGVLSFNTHQGGFGHQIGLSSDGNLYHRYVDGGTHYNWNKLLTSGNQFSKEFCVFNVGEIYNTIGNENPATKWMGTTWTKLGTSNIGGNTVNYWKRNS